MPPDKEDDLHDESLLHEDDDHTDPPPGEDAQPQAEDSPGEDAPPPADDIEIELEADPRLVEEAPGALDREEPVERSDAEYSRAVRERIGREQRIAREQRTRADAEHQARIRAEHRSRDVQRVALETTMDAIDAQIKTTTEALKKAADDGKSDAQVEHTRTLSRLDARKEEIARAQAQLKDDEERAKAADVAGPNLLAEQWKQRNAWYGSPRFVEQTLVTRAIDATLSHAGYDKNSAEYYAELDRRVRQRMPELRRFGQARPGNERQQPGERGQPRRQPVGPARRTSPVDPRARPGKVKLGKPDFANMRAFGLDPTNPEHQKEYARNKVEGGTNAT